MIVLLKHEEFEKEIYITTNLVEILPGNLLSEIESKLLSETGIDFGDYVWQKEFIIDTSDGIYVVIILREEHFKLIKRCELLGEILKK
jgi:hypothetical protein